MHVLRINRSLYIAPYARLCVGNMKIRISFKFCSPFIAGSGSTVGVAINKKMHCSAECNLLRNWYIFLSKHISLLLITHIHYCSLSGLIAGSSPQGKNSCSRLDWRHSAGTGSYSFLRPQRMDCPLRGNKTVVDSVTLKVCGFLLYTDNVCLNGQLLLDVWV